MRHHARRAVADVETANAAGEVEIAIAVDIFQCGAFRGSMKIGALL